MDQTTRTIAGYVASRRQEDLSDRAVAETKRRLVDSLGCAFGAIDSPPARIARAVAGEVTARHPSTVIGYGASTMEEATFANTVMVRYLDHNDMYFSPRGGGGHPSDLIATSLAVGEAFHATGADVLLAVATSYEVLGAMIGLVRLRELGWDQGLYTVIAAATAAGKLMGLDAEQLGHAVSLAVTPHVPMRQTRVGELSMWKGCATAGAARCGVYAAQLAAKGITGPPSPFEGADGLWKQVTGEFELALPVHADGPLVVEQIHTKSRPAEYNSQGAIDLAVEFRAKLDLDLVERIEVETYWLAYSEIGSEPAKWDPHTRETADHSLPYLIAVALLDGDVTPASFTDERIADPRVRSLMRRIGVVESQDCTDRFPAELPCRMTFHLADGSQLTQEVVYPHGHVRNPLTDGELDAKFDRLIASFDEPNAAVCREARQHAWQLETLEDVGTLMRPLGQLDARS